tara:strand:+ start:42 stop:440 length:399 start_codon:yes stop_codon:yes gene_type:complete
MSRQLITIPLEEGNNRYILVASVRPDFDAFMTYMAKKGVPVKDDVELPGVHSADYRNVGLGDVRVGYHGPAKILVEHKGSEMPVNLGSLLFVSGLEQEVVEGEANGIIECMDEVEDPGSVQRYVALYDRLND